MRKSIGSQGHRALIDLLIKKRKAAGLKQEDVAMALEESQPWVAHLESGQRRVDILEYVTLARVIGFDAVDELSKLIASVDMTLVDDQS